MRPRQLVSVLSDVGFPTPSSKDQKKRTIVPYFPYVSWPDLRPCIAINSYLLYLFAEDGRKFSLFNKGGTLTTYAKELTHIVRYCHLNRIGFLGMTDTRFVGFYKYLSAQLGVAPEGRRSTNYVVRLLMRTLDFLEYVHVRFGGGKKMLIKTSRRDVKGRDGHTHSVWQHPCFPVLEDSNKRFPIGNDVIKKLKVGIPALWPSTNQKSYLLQRRKLTLISILEHLGCRRAEAAMIKVEELYKAFDMPYKTPLLKIPNVKGKRKFRYVPIRRAQLSQWIDYVETARFEVLDRLGADDNGYLFVSHVSGDPLSYDYITTEINELRRRLKIGEPCHPHLFRHRFITEIVKLLAIQYHSDTPERFKDLLISETRLLKDLREWVGHASVESLAIYVDHAYEELGGTDQIYDDVQRTLALDEGSERLDELARLYRAGELSETEWIFLCRECLEMTRVEISR
ncbi:hypothetical protein B8W72_26155 [Pseudomonas putida]|uniref:Tyr recombinase domain-containing protein n=2 Tax=Pseudomonas putida TaxID=303 RepID=A0A1Y3KG47_PSEPU|nr:hypothetical protein B8W72_26155 [Pseudomonas putida]